jgi:hypothetical protein
MTEIPNDIRDDIHDDIAELVREIAGDWPERVAGGQCWPHAAVGPVVFKICGLAARLVAGTLVARRGSFASEMAEYRRASSGRRNQRISADHDGVDFGFDR